MAPVIDKAFCQEHLRASPYGPLQNPCEEDTRPWGEQAAVANKPLMRIWDRLSKDVPDKSNCLSSSRPREYLNSYKARQNALASLVSDRNIYTDLEPETPFVAFQAYDSEISNTARVWPKGRCGSEWYLTVINPNVRAANGLPTLNLLEEASHYKANPSRSSWPYYGGQYLCPWQVTPAEVIKTWVWDNLCEDENWYKNIVYPAFLEHDRAAREARERESARPCMGNLGTALSAEINRQLPQMETDLERVSHTDRDTSATVTSGLGGEYDMPSKTISEVATEIDSDVDA